jgi:ATP-dependent Lon protease
MRDFCDAKLMARSLRESLKTKAVSITHGESLELIAKILGVDNWNILSAQRNRPEALRNTSLRVL